ncbi:MAG: phospho-N-acetylmuramoyl-pentapeptide-transferase [Bacteroidales bacterium]|jgi:phospho-N-acetylmuramoyl-pentapeptide-transferase|nr:phospho-N-acetylmuramoyl-pentapeptide-transferase [Bacteroidales bacterium]OQC01944.1 MAG: Phospho-N-acetylmuramoyl-pentapeptide-transferase [Bacteroidetes bacterium ADurb.Bin090]HOD26834.1 phospho-N-acetylmuramoyl-pentapeptide-transferase [Bacteroidales bacterium]HPN46843.1 phospho-N-acetylmuramoyl-pentapeptide-transferase [Bacteroidales bacterium]HQB70833.1 phospho-N-acetylmuramoyl-pentapeptide-transferase [Bacteroidales bacterium]
MLVPLFDYLNSIDFTGAGMFQYVSFRSIMAFIFSLLIATFIGRKIILKLQRMQIGDVPRDLDVEGQLSKKGTPTMGGIIIFLSLIVPVLLFAKLDNIYIILMLISTVWLTLLGFADDYIKVFKKHREGLKGKFKIIGQVGIGLIVGLTLYLSPEVVIRENVQLNNGLPNEEVRFEEGEVKSTKTTIPFFKNNNLDYANLVCFMKEHKQAAGWVLFVLVTIFIVTAVSNGANLTDGLDGLTTGTSAIIGVGLGILAYVSSNMNFASYLNIMYIPGSEELVIYMSAFVGATVGFLWFNSFPAQVFMGDTGSLMLGGVIAVFAIIIRKELMLLFFCGVFLLESLSVMMQVSYFKWTKKRYGVGKRIFKMAPLHHHFQKPGNAGIEALIQKPIKAIPESKIVVRFWIISLLLAAFAIITLKIR